jgi:hypothetical protein
MRWRTNVVKHWIRTLSIVLIGSLGLLFDAVGAGALGGPVLIGGDDADDHGFFSGGNQAGWLYIEDGFNNIGPAVANGGTIAVCLGCNGSTASAGFASGFDSSTLPGLGWTRTTLTSATDLAAFFAGTGAVHVGNAGIIYMPSDYGNVAGGINPTQVAVVNANASGLNGFVSAGGGLFAHTQQFVAGGFGWLTTLLPGISFVDGSGCDLNVLNLTAQGAGAFPQLTDAILSNATPWHNYFQGDFGGLDVLSTGPCGSGPRAVILGGANVVIQQLIELSPAVALNTPGQDHTVTAMVEDALGAPQAGVAVTFAVVSGPNAGASGTCSFNADCTTDANGAVFFTYTGNGTVGVDTIEASFVDGGGNTVVSNSVLKFWDDDCNQNDVADTCDLDCGGFGGLCGSAGSCGTSSDANGDGVPDECNAPPDCSRAGAEPDEIWPPNHNFKTITIQGVTDEDGDPVSVSFASIRQDEPLVGGGSGSFSPDGSGVGTDTAAVRAERAGIPALPGNGRVYHLGFSADDGRGGTCEGSVTVCVPHDMRPGHACVDDGALYDSTVYGGGSSKAKCGLGFELALLLPPLVAARRRRAARAS